MSVSPQLQVKIHEQLQRRMLHEIFRVKRDTQLVVYLSVPQAEAWFWQGKPLGEKEQRQRDAYKQIHALWAMRPAEERGPEPIVTWCLPIKIPRRDMQPIIERTAEA